MQVVYRGYQASSQLQNLCDQAIKTRTELKLKQEEQEQREVRGQRTALKGAVVESQALALHKHAAPTWAAQRMADCKMSGSIMIVLL